MDLKTFIETVNNNPVQHYGSHVNFTDVTFALFRATEVPEGLKVTGHWMNVHFCGPMPNGNDEILITHEQIPNWILHKRFPKYNA